MVPWLGVDTQVCVSMPRSQVSWSSVGTMRREMKDTVFLKYVLEWKTCGLQQWGRFEFGCSWISYVLAGKAWLIMCVSLMLQSAPSYPQLCSVCLLPLGMQHEGSPLSRKGYCCSREKSNGKKCNVFKDLVSDGVAEHLHCSQSKLEDACRPGTLFTGRSRVEVWERRSHDREQWNTCALKVL